MKLTELPNQDPKSFEFAAFKWKLTELPNQDPKSFEFAAFKWLVKRFARPSRRLQIGLTPILELYGITVDGLLVESAPTLTDLCLLVEAKGLK